MRDICEVSLNVYPEELNRMSLFLACTLGEIYEGGNDFRVKVILWKDWAALPDLGGYHGNLIDVRGYIKTKPLHMF